MNSNLRHSIAILIWYTSLLLYYWHSLLLVNSSKLDGYGTDDLIWESSFAFTVLIVGGYIGWIDNNFKIWNKIKEGLLHIIFLGSASLGILYATSSNNFSASFSPVRIPVFVIFGIITFVLSSYTFHRIKNHPSNQSLSNSSSHMNTIIVGVVSSVLASAITGASGYVITKFFIGGN